MFSEISLQIRLETTMKWFGLEQRNIIIASKSDQI